MIDPIIIFAFIEVESSFKRGVFLNDRNGGSYGLMQIDLATAEDRGFGGNALDLYEPVTNLEYGAKILAWIADDLDKHGMLSLTNLAAAYNSGLRHVVNGGTDAPYVDKIKTAYAKWDAAVGTLIPRALLSNML
jgi:soluble lytic murein transglycosylase-like protein